jgi:hypothetical protein
VLFACFLIVATCCVTVLSVNFSSVEEKEPKPQAGGEGTVNHQTAISTEVSFQDHLLYSDIGGPGPAGGGGGGRG